jgi:hypothetical protein
VPGQNFQPAQILHVEIVPADGRTISAGSKFRTGTNTSVPVENCEPALMLRLSVPGENFQPALMYQCRFNFLSGTDVVVLGGKI